MTIATDRTEEKPDIRWVYAPLIVFVVVSLWLIPSGVIVLLSGEIDWEWIAYTPMIVAVANWGLLALFIVMFGKAKKEWPLVGSVQTAMWCSLLLMLIPCVVVIGYPFAEPSGGMGQGLAAALIVTPILQPILGVIGWFVGRGVYRSRHRA